MPVDQAAHYRLLATAVLTVASASRRDRWSQGPPGIRLIADDGSRAPSQDARSAEDGR
jgi:hypothetical protein